jgi:hypothetical protein
MERTTNHPQTPLETSGTRAVAGGAAPAAAVVAVETALGRKSAPSRGGTMALNKLIVSAYKLIGFAVLTAILAGLISYLGLNLFYFFNRSWVTPTIISPTDERVLQLNTERAQQESLRDKLRAERAELLANLHDNDRIIAVQQQFQESYSRAVQADRRDRAAELAKLHSLARAYLQAKAEIESSNEAYSRLSRQRGQDLAAANLIAEDAQINSDYQLAQIAHANLTLEEKEVELDTKTALLRREEEALGAALAPRDGAQLSYDALRIRQEYQRSVLEAERARESRGAIARGISALDASIARFDRILNTIERSPYLLALDRKVTVAFVPYANLPGLSRGQALFGCRLRVLACSTMGKVVDILPGEVAVKHPLHNTMLRGQMVQIELGEASAAEQPVLFAGRPPLFL